MNSLEQAKKIYERCVSAAKEKSLLTYRDVLDYLGYGEGVTGQAIRFGLELAWIACADKGLPILTSIIVNKATGKPSVEGYPVADWEADSKKVFSREKWPSSEDIDWDCVWENRSQLSSKHGTRGYWSR